MKYAPIFGIIIVIVAINGWGMNLYKLCKTDFESPYKAEVIRTIGLTPPIGAIIGYITIEDGVKK